MLTTKQLGENGGRNPEEEKKSNGGEKSDVADKADKRSYLEVLMADTTHAHSKGLTK